MAESFDRFAVKFWFHAGRIACAGCSACRRPRGVAGALQVITRNVSVDQMLCGIDRFRLSRREWTMTMDDGDIAITDPTGIRAFGRGSWM